MSADMEREFRELVGDYRSRCLWYLRADYLPADTAERLRVLEAIERYGDLRAFQRAARLRSWLSPTSSATSAGKMAEQAV